jgi:predicted transcriptional regulator
MISEVQDTSILAFHEIEAQGILGKNQKKVLSLLIERGPLTNREIAAALGMEINGITPRIFELRALYLVEERGRKRDLQTKRLAIVWGATRKEKQKSFDF